MVCFNYNFDRSTRLQYMFDEFKWSWDVRWSLEPSSHNCSGTKHYTTGRYRCSFPQQRPCQREYVTMYKLNCCMLFKFSDTCLKISINRPWNTNHTLYNIYRRTPCSWQTDRFCKDETSMVLLICAHHFLWFKNDEQNSKILIT